MLIRCSPAQYVIIMRSTSIRLLLKISVYLRRMKTGENGARAVLKHYVADMLKTLAILVTHTQLLIGFNCKRNRYLSSFKMR